MDSYYNVRGHNISYFKTINSIVIKNWSPEEIINSKTVYAWIPILHLSTLPKRGPVFNLLKYLINYKNGSIMSFVFLTSFYSINLRQIFTSVNDLQQFIVKNYDQDRYRINERDLVLWSHVNLGYENPVLLPTEVVTISQDSSPAPSVAADGENSERSLTCGQLKTKTRSYENLNTPHSEGLQRCQSYPSLKDGASVNTLEKCPTQTHEDYLFQGDHTGVHPTLHNGLGIDTATTQCEVCKLSKKLHDESQSRLNVIISGYKIQVESLQKELEVTRLALLKQVGHKCTHVALDRGDDNVSLAESVCSGEHHSVGRESQHCHSSEFSWEAVEEKDTRPPLWLPDFAVTRCMGCDGKFWLGRRKHHCRPCGKVFCADCSEHTMTIPSENIYTPVRVCMSCYHRHNSSARAQKKTITEPLTSVTPGRPHLCRSCRKDCKTQSHTCMMGSYAAVVSGDASFQMNGNCPSSFSFETHHTESGSPPNTDFISSGYGSCSSTNDVPNGHSTCNGVSNTVSYKSKHNGVAADIHSLSNGVSNGHPE